MHIVFPLMSNKIGKQKKIIVLSIQKKKINLKIWIYFSMEKQYRLKKKKYNVLICFDKIVSKKCLIFYVYNLSKKQLKMSGEKSGLTF